MTIANVRQIFLLRWLLYFPMEKQPLLLNVNIFVKLLLVMLLASSSVAAQRGNSFNIIQEYKAMKSASFRDNFHFDNWSKEWRDHLKFQEYLHQNQNPSKCHPASVIKTGERRDGLGADIRHQVHSFLYAVEVGKTFMFSKTSKYVNPQQCPLHNLECYFIPPGNCTTSSHADKAIPPCYHIVPKRLAASAGLLSVYSRAWFLAEAYFFLLRPNERLQALIQQMRLETDLPPVGQFIAVHIRHNDKREGSIYTIQAYGEVLKRTMWTHDLYTVFLATDDPLGYSKLDHFLKSDKMLMALSNGTLRVAMLPAHHFLPLTTEPVEVARRLKKGEFIDGHDEGLALIAQAFLAAEGRVLIAAQTSNYSKLMILLQHIHRIRNDAGMIGAPFFHDMDNEPEGTLLCHNFPAANYYTPIHALHKSRSLQQQKELMKTIVETEQKLL